VLNKEFDFFERSGSRSSGESGCVRRCTSLKNQTQAIGAGALGAKPIEGGLNFGISSSINQVLQGIEIRDWEREAEGARGWIVCLWNRFGIGTRLNKNLGDGERPPSTHGPHERRIAVGCGGIGICFGGEEELGFLKVVDGGV
jgi:hypothetical protein